MKPIHVLLGAAIVAAAILVAGHDVADAIYAPYKDRVSCFQHLREQHLDEHCRAVLATNR